MRILSTKNLLTAMMVSAFSVSAGADQQSGTLSFHGYIYNSTCTVMINDEDSRDADIDMGRYSTNDFTHAGDEVGGEGNYGKFNLKLKGCPGHGDVTLSMKGKIANGERSHLALDNEGADGVAKNIAIRIYDTDDLVTPYNVNFDTTYKFSDETPEKEWEVGFIAKYVSTADEVEAGRADATLDYQITYK